MFSPNTFNLHFTSAAAGSRSDEVFDRDEVFDGSAFSCVEKAVVFNTIMSTKSGAVGADGFFYKVYSNCGSIYFVSSHSFI
jgi:hypothetical protein